MASQGRPPAAWASAQPGTAASPESPPPEEDPPVVPEELPVPPVDDDDEEEDEPVPPSWAGSATVKSATADQLLFPLEEPARTRQAWCPAASPATDCVTGEAAACGTARERSGVPATASPA